MSQNWESNGDRYQIRLAETHAFKLPLHWKHKCRWPIVSDECPTVALILSRATCQRWFAGIWLGIKPWFFKRNLTRFLVEYVGTPRRLVETGLGNLVMGKTGRHHRNSILETLYFLLILSGTPYSKIPVLDIDFLHFRMTLFWST